MIRCIIVEDERLAQQVIKSHLSRVDRFELLGVFGNGIDAKNFLETNDVDLIFLDIQLPGMTGLNFLRELEHQPLVVLTTAYPEYALESYEFNVIDYLLKPISFERFSKTVNKISDGKIFSEAKQEKYFNSDHIFIKSNSKFFRVNFSEITYIQSMRDYMKIHTRDYTVLTHQTMTEMENSLPQNMFIRIHKSYMVSMKHVLSVYGNSVDMGSIVLPIGLNYKEKLMTVIERK